MPALGRTNPSNQGTHPKHQCKGCPTCPHKSSGPPVHGSPNVFVNGNAALRATGPGGAPGGGPPDGGGHDKGTCCGENKWVCAVAQNRGVYINGILAFCDTDQTQHDKDGNFGQLKITPGSNVFVGS